MLPILRRPPLGRLLQGVVPLVLTACVTADRALAPAAPRRSVGPNNQAAGVVVSQVYGGGGNSGAPLRNDFIELYNAADTAVSVAGWSVQYTSATGTTWQVTALPSGASIPARSFYLVQEAAGSNGSAPALPTPDAVGTIPMSSSAGKVALVSNATALTGACPIPGAAVLDFVGYGSTANCAEGGRPAPTLSNTTADVRSTVGGGGLQDSDVNGDDFTALAPNPRNSGNSSGPGAGVVVQVGSSAVGPLNVADTTVLAATVTRNGAAVTPSSVTWAVAQASPEGRFCFANQTGAQVTGVAYLTGTHTVRATVTVDGQQYTGSRDVQVTAPPGALTVEGYTFRGCDPLPVGFQELYRVRDLQSAPPRTGRDPGVAFSTSNPNVARVDALGNVTAVADGRANVVATLNGTRVGLLPVRVTTFQFSDTTGVYRDALQFGAPSGPSLAGNVLVRRVTFASSWSNALGQPSWVAYDLNAATRAGASDRCDCFTPDPLLGSANKVVTTADYDGAGFSRGHMTMSADRTRGALDNATTFYFSNIIPQTNQNNGGPWLGLEQYLGSQATGSNKEVYVFDGGAAYSGFLASANPALAGRQRVAIPTWTWKVAVLMDRGRGAADVRSASDVRVIAVAVPNTTTIPQTTASWVNYQTSVDSVQSLTGFSLFSALPAGLRGQLTAASAAGPRPVGLHLQPERISVGATAVVTAVLYSGTDFDATSFDPAALRLVTASGTQVAPVGRGGVVNTSVRDVNGDGKPDRVVSFATSALRAAGFSASAPALTLRLAGGGTPDWVAGDPTPSAVVP